MQTRKISFVWMAAAFITVSMLGAARRLSAQQETVLYNFGNGSDASDPQGDLTVDSSGNFYSTSGTGGAYGLGTVYSLTRNADGTWGDKILHSFGNGNDGVQTSLRCDLRYDGPSLWHHDRGRGS